MTQKSGTTAIGNIRIAKRWKASGVKCANAIFELAHTLRADANVQVERDLKRRASATSHCLFFEAAASVWAAFLSAHARARARIRIEQIGKHRKRGTSSVFAPCDRQ